MKIKGSTIFSIHKKQFTANGNCYIMNKRLNSNYLFRDKGAIYNERKSLLDQWRDMAYDRNLSKNELETFWSRYFTIEKKIYEQLLDNPEEEVRGTVKELAEKYGQDVMTMVGFLDGINDSLKVPNPIETMDENTDVTLVFDKEMLYKNMVDAKADWLYELPQWDKIFDADTKKKLYREQKQSGTVRKAKRSAEMSLVHVEVERNINIAVERMHKKCIKCSKVRHTDTDSVNKRR